MPIGRQDFLDRSGHRLSSVDTTAFWKGCGPCLALPRSEMHAILRGAPGGLTVATGRMIASLRHVPNGCEVTFDDHSTRRYDLVVGADGIHSDLRRLAVDARPPSYSGNFCWRFFAPNVARIESWTVMIGKGRTLLAIPVDRARVYVYADLAVASADSRKFSARSDLRTVFADFAAPLAPLLHEISPATPIHFDRIETVRLKNWVSGRVVLIGDAAHACSPSMAEGAGMACEDAIVLADAITSTDDLDLALASFVERRRQRVAWVEAQSEARDRMRRLPTAISNRLLRYAGPALYRRSYRPLLRPI